MENRCWSFRAKYAVNFDEFWQCSWFGVSHFLHRDKAWNAFIEWRVGTNSRTTEISAVNVPLGAPRVIDRNQQQPDSSSPMDDCVADDDVLHHTGLNDNTHQNSSPTKHHSEQTQNSSSPNEMEISVVLALFRHRQNLSKSCTNDLCDMLRSLGVKHVPADFRSIEKKSTDSTIDPYRTKTVLFWPSCGMKNTNALSCEKAQCEAHARFKMTPGTVCTFKILPQLVCILERHAVINEVEGDHSLMHDLHHGELYRQLIHQHRQYHPEVRLITFLLNSGGVLVKRFNRSIWITCMVINELPRSVRFNIENIIICSISMGGTKPKKNQSQRLLKIGLRDCNN